MAVDELSPYCGRLLRRRNPFRYTTASRLERGEVIVERKTVAAPEQGRIYDLAPNQAMRRTPGGKWELLTFELPKHIASPLRAHWLQYRKDYCMVLWLAFLYIIALGLIP